MSDIFISHSRTDAEAAARLCRWLNAQGHRSVFLDFDPEFGIPPGRDWERELYGQIRSCRAVVALCSSHWMASKWCFAEITQARSLGKAVLPVKIDNCTLEGVITDTQCIDMTAGETVAYERLWSGLLTAGLDPASAFDWDGSRSPYPGLLPFQEDDAAVFFGRDDEIAAGLDLLNKVRRLGSAGVVMVLGASGSGKSSLVRAGLVPRLRRDTDRWLVVDPFRPRDDPVRELAGVVSRAFAMVGETREQSRIRGLLRAALSPDEPPHVNALAEAAHELRLLANRSEARVLLVVDQFEELLGFEPNHPSTRLMALMRSATELESSPILLLGTLRSDFLSAMQSSPALLDLHHEFLSVGSLSPEDITQIIERPAEVAGLELEPGLVQAMVADAGDEDALPLLAFALRELLDHWAGDGRLGVKEYRDRLGGLGGAVAAVADELIESEQLEPGQEDELRLAFLAMVRLAEDERRVRRVVRWDDLPDSIHPTLQRFVTARLLVSGGDGHERTVEVAHEALFRSWRRLVGWLDQNAEELRLRRDLQLASRSWDMSGREVAELWRGARLARAGELVDSGDLPLDLPDREFVEASQRAERAEFEQRVRGEQAQSFSRSLRLAADARALVSDEPETALLLAWEAVLWDCNERAEEVFRETLEANPRPVDVLDRGADITASGFLQTTGVYVCTDRHRVTVWDRDGKYVASFFFPVLSGELTAVGHPNHARLVSIGAEGVVRLTAVDGHTIDELDLEPSEPLRHPQVSFSRQGDCLVHDRGRGWLVDIDSSGTFGSPAAPICFSLKGNKSVRLYRQPEGYEDIPVHPELESFEREQHDNHLSDARLSPDGRRILTISGPYLGIWDIAGELLAVYRDEHLVIDALFLAGNLIVTGTTGGTGQILNEQGELLHTYTSETGTDTLVLAVNDARDLFATTAHFGPTENVAKLWSLDGELIGAIEFDVGERVRSASFAPSSQTLAVGNDAGKIQVWELDPLRKVLDLHGHVARVTALTFEPEHSEQLLSISLDGETRLWDLVTPTLPDLPGLEPASTDYNDRTGTRLEHTAAGVLGSRRANPARLWDPDGNVITLDGPAVYVSPWGPTTRESYVITRKGNNGHSVWQVHPGIPPHHLCTIPSIPPDAWDPVPPTPVFDIAPDGATFLRSRGSRGRCVELWSMSGELLAELTGSDDPHLDTSGSLDWAQYDPTEGRIVTASNNGMVWLWRPDGALIGSFLTDHSSPDRTFAVSVDPHGEGVLVGIRRHAIMWDWDCNSFYDYRSRGYKVKQAIFSPDGSRLVTFADNARGNDVAEIWQRNGERLADLDASVTDKGLFNIAGGHICIVSGYDVRIFDESGKLLGTLSGPIRTQLIDAAIAPDGEYVAALFDDWRVRVWNFPQSRRTMTFPVPPAHRIVFTADGHRLLIASQRGPIHQIALEINDLFPAAAQRIGRGVGSKEIARFELTSPMRLNSLPEIGQSPLIGRGGLDGT